MKKVERVPWLERCIKENRALCAFCRFSGKDWDYNEFSDRSFWYLTCEHPIKKLRDSGLCADDFSPETDCWGFRPKVTPMNCVTCPQYRVVPCGIFGRMHAICEEMNTLFNELRSWRANKAAPKRIKSPSCCPKVIVLSKEGTKAFLEMLENPPEPNEKLKAAAKRYREIVEPSVDDDMSFIMDLIRQCLTPDELRRLRHGEWTDE